MRGTLAAVAGLGVPVGVVRSVRRGQDVGRTGRVPPVTRIAATVVVAGFLRLLAGAALVEDPD